MRRDFPSWALLGRLHPRVSGYSGNSAILVAQQMSVRNRDSQPTRLNILNEDKTRGDSSKSCD